MAGCSGFVQYTMAGVIFTIGFSNPSVGNNKVGIGFSGKGVTIDPLAALRLHVFFYKKPSEGPSIKSFLIFFKF